MNGQNPTKPQDCWDWITPEHVSRLALAAYSLASRQCQPTDGAPFLDIDGEAYAGPYDFAEMVSQLFVLKLGTAAAAAGIDGFEHCAEQLATWAIPVSAGAGRSPADKGHGWPAFDSSAGSAAKPALPGRDAGEMPT